MANDTYILDELELSGFRAFLKPHLFEFGSKPCLAVFAPNGKGKSSIIDALEFMFSEDGTLARLGQRAVNNQAGITAIAHNMADEPDTEPFVRVRFKYGNQKIDGSRDASGTSPPRPEIANTVKACFAVDPLIRGHDLRRFVEGETAEQRYRSVANWLQLGPLVAVQSNLRTLRINARDAAESRTALNAVNTQLRNLSNNEITAWDDDDVLNYANNLLDPLDDAISLESLDRSDPSFVTVHDRAESEEMQTGLQGLKQQRSSLAKVYAETETANTNGTCISGYLHDFEVAVSNVLGAKINETEERISAANAVFSDIWKAAESVFSDEEIAPDICPVCDTPIVDSSAGSIEGVQRHIALHRKELRKYDTAKKQLTDATDTVSKQYTNITVGLGTLAGVLTKEHASLKTEINKYQVALSSWTSGNFPNAVALKSNIISLWKELDSTIEAVEKKQDVMTYRKAITILEKLCNLKIQREYAIRLIREKEILLNRLNEQSVSVSKAIRDKVQALLNSLQEPINRIYRHIQGDDAVPIRLELPSEDDITQHRLNLVVDFADNRKGVPPSGYLSDSQIHSLALSLRLAAIKRFNTKAPFIALDDIVTSFDADHRRAIAAMLANEFTRFQLIITTHDNRFFIYLKDQLDRSHWNFKRISRLDADYGPRFRDHKVTNAMIEARWNEGQPAANEMRQAEEEWLYRICQDFGVNLRIRTVERAYSYERSELAEALSKYLKNKDITPPLVPGVNNRFLISLHQGAIENFGSHFNDDPYSDGSIGDEKTRWAEFKFFKEQFVCPSCGKSRFKRPQRMTNAVCSDEKCETKFKFKESVASAEHHVESS